MKEIKRKLSRRKFLKISGIGAAAAATAGVANRIYAAKKVIKGAKTKRRLAMVIDLRKCYGCHSCSVSCKSEFEVPLGVWRSWIKVTEKGKYPNVKRQFLPLLCNHCENTPCLKGCPATAIKRDDNGIVHQLEEQCIGCGYCLQTCPYKMRFRHPTTKVANKCDFCRDRVLGGVEPSCVNTCPANARIFGDLKDPKSEVSKLISLNPVKTLLPEQNTHPKVFYIGLDETMYTKRASERRKH